MNHYSPPFVLLPRHNYQKWIEPPILRGLASHELPPLSPATKHSLRTSSGEDVAERSDIPTGCALSYANRSFPDSAPLSTPTPARRSHYRGDCRKAGAPCRADPSTHDA